MRDHSVQVAPARSPSRSCVCGPPLSSTFGFRILSSKQSGAGKNTFSPRGREGQRKGERELGGGGDSCPTHKINVCLTGPLSPCLPLPLPLVVVLARGVASHRFSHLVGGSANTVGLNVNHAKVARLASEQVSFPKLHNADSDYQVHTIVRVRSLLAHYVQYVCGAAAFLSRRSRCSSHVITVFAIIMRSWL